MRGGALQRNSWPRSDARQNALPKGAATIEAMCLGMSWDYSCQQAGLFSTSMERPSLTRMLTSFAGWAPDKTFTHTGTRLNRGYSARVHVGVNNVGASYIIVVGGYSDGELWVMGKGGMVGMTVRRNMQGQPYQVNDKLPGKMANVRGLWHAFGGLAPRAAVGFTGQRVSLMYFTSKHAGKMDPGCRRTLTGSDSSCQELSLIL